MRRLVYRLLIRDSWCEWTQGRTIEECKRSLAEAIALILEDRRQNALQGVPEDVIQEQVAIA